MLSGIGTTVEPCWMCSENNKNEKRMEGEREKPEKDHSGTYLSIKKSKNIFNPNTTNIFLAN